MELSYFEIFGVVLFLLLFSRSIMKLSLSVFITSTTVLLAMLMFAISTLILSIAAVPAYLVACKVADNMYSQKPTPSVVVDWCGVKAKTPKVVRSRNIEMHEFYTQPNSSQGKY